MAIQSSPQTPWASVRPRLTYMIAVPLVGLALGAVVAVRMAQDGPGSGDGRDAKSSAALRQPNTDDGDAASRSFDGFTVEVQEAVRSAEGSLQVQYRIRVDGTAAFGDMLGIPRIINPNGSDVLPVEYGDAVENDSSHSEIPGLSSLPSRAVFDAASVQPGAFIRFGPFFRSVDEPFAMSAPGESLLSGHEVSISGERFIVTARPNGNGTTTIEFANIEPGATVVATHPGSAVSVEIDGSRVGLIHGSTNFAKTVGYDVNANRSTIDILGEISPGNDVSITTNSIGKVHRGQWDFPLD